MTNRQFVLQYYPEAKLEYHVMPRNTMSPFIYYTVETKDFSIRGETRDCAWKNAKQKTKRIVLTFKSTV